MPMIRADHADVVYKTEKEKFRAVIDEIEECNRNSQPVLVGTVSIENSERLSKLLQRRKIKHVVLNAKYHEREADIVAQAGRVDAVTIATNMAGRGTDIVLGGNPETMTKMETDPAADPDEYAKVLARYEGQCKEQKQTVLDAGGLHILGTERHESRRIDNQLRGRCGRQGDPGSSRFFLSLEDDLMRIFASDWVRKMMDRLGMEEDIPIESRMVSKSIERAQKQVEGRNFEIRKHLLEYDDVMNKQREAVYSLRRRILEGIEGRNYILRVVDDIVGSLIDLHCPEEADPEDWEIDTLKNEYRGYFGLTVNELGIDWETVNRPQLEEILLEGAPGWRNSSSWTPSIVSGRTTCWPSTTSARASVSGLTDSGIHWSSTSVSLSHSSRTCGSGSRTTWSSSSTTPSRWRTCNSSDGASARRSHIQRRRG
jgi:preprotein translocase subunit SecA